MGKKSKSDSIAKTKSNLNIVHHAVMEEDYEFGLSKLKTICAKRIPEELIFYSKKLNYELKRSLCDWDSKFAEETKEIMDKTMDDIAPSGLRTLAVDPYFALCLPFSPSQLCQLNQAHAQCPPSEIGEFSMRKQIPRNDRSYRVGYMSSDFHDHSLSHLVSSMARFHRDRDPIKFEVYMIHLRHDSDFGKEDTFFRNQVNQGAKKVIDLSKIKNDSDAAKSLASYDLDILVDYDSNSSQHRRGILAKKPAKIQVLSMIGFCGSSGNLAVDYVLTDQTIAPLPILDHHYTEKKVFLPGCYLTADYPSLFPHLQYETTLITQHGPIVVNGFQPLPLWIDGQSCIRRIEEMLKKGWKELELNGLVIYCSKLPRNWRHIPLQDGIVITCRTKFNLPTQGVVFCNLCPSWKLDPETFSGWMEILRRVPNSVLWQFDGNETLIKNMKKFAKEKCVDADRLVFSPFENEKEAHLRRIQLSDVALDTTPFNGHTSTMDAMWAGIPIVTVTGTTAQGRVSTSILKTMGLPQLIAKTREEAIEIAVELGKDATKLWDLKRVIQERKLSSSLFNVAEYVSNLEGLYSAIMRRYEKGKKPCHIIMEDFEDLEMGEPSEGGLHGSDSETEARKRKIFVAPSSQLGSSLPNPYIRLGPKINPQDHE